MHYTPAIYIMSVIQVVSLGISIVQVSTMLYKPLWSKQLKIRLTIMSIVIAIQVSFTLRQNFKVGFLKDINALGALFTVNVIYVIALEVYERINYVVYISNVHLCVP